MKAEITGVYLANLDTGEILGGIKKGDDGQWYSVPSSSTNKAKSPATTQEYRNGWQSIFGSDRRTFQVRSELVGEMMIHNKSPPEAKTPSAS